MKKYKILSFITFFGLLLFIMPEANAQQENIQIQQHAKIEKLMEVKTDLNRNNKIGDRYVIQLFYGDNGEANEILKEYKALYTFPSKIAYEAPNYKVWIGNFRNRLEADRALLKIKENFPGAFIPKVQRR